jgi:hypothetical protein
VAGVGFAAGVFPQVTDADGNVDPVAAAVAFLMYLTLAFVQVYFHAATVAGAHERLAGGDPTVGSALRKANRHLGRLFVWSIMVATVNVVLQALRERAGAIGRILAGLGGMAWNLMTYFVVPLLLFEDQGIGASLKRSGGLFRKTWGESLVGQVGIGAAGAVVTFLWLLVGMALMVALFSGFGIAGGITGLVILVLGIVVVSVIFTVAGAVYKTALYRYASDGHAGGTFQDDDLKHAYAAR